MKRFILLTIAAASLGFASCSDDAVSTDLAKEGYGKIMFQSSADGLVATRAEVDVTKLGVTKPEPGDFNLTLKSVTLNNEEASAVNVSGVTVGEFNAQSQTTFFESGTYSAFVTLGDPAEEGVDKPYYYGENIGFTVNPRTTNTVEITAKIANSIVQICTTENFDSFFENASFTIITAAGNKFTVTPTALNPSAAYFVAAGKKIEVTGTAQVQSQNGVDEGATVNLTASTLEETVACTRHTFKFDAANAGSATVKITISEDDEVLKPVNVELNDYAKKE